MMQIPFQDAKYDADINEKLIHLSSGPAYIV